MRRSTLLALLTVLAITPIVDAQGPFSAQIQRAINTLTTGGISFTSLRLTDGSVTAPSLAYKDESTLGLFRPQANTIDLTVASASRIRFSDLGVETRGYFALGATIGSPDIFIQRDGANIASLRNGTNPQTQRWFGTFTDASNYERIEIITTAGTTLFQQAQAGTGIARNLSIGTSGGTALIFFTSNVNRWQIESGGDFNGTTATAKLGYTTGAGGTVTQLTSKSTGVTLNTVTGEITMNGAALAAATTVTFTLTNSAIAVGDCVDITHISAGTLGAYNTGASAAAGSATVYVRNVHTASLSEAIVLKMRVFKCVTS